MKWNEKKEMFSTIKVEKDSAESLDVHLKVDYGEVNISSGAAEWVDGAIHYNYTALEPKVKYRLTRNKGKLAIDQPKLRKSTLKKGELENVWDLKLTNELPMDVKIETGASDTKLNLQGMMLRNVDVESGVGKTTIDLSGEWEESFTVNLEMGVGQTTVILPKEVGVKVKAEKGIGSLNFVGFISEADGIYVNEAHQNTDTVITVNAEMGIGEANFEVEK